MDINFYYVVWGNLRWEILSFSIIFLRRIYKKNNITIICYTNPPTFFLNLKKDLNFKILFLHSNRLLDKFNDDTNEIYSIHKNLIYKTLNCFELASTSNSKNIILDCDVFIINEFDEFDWSKICLYCNQRYVNTGVVGFDSSTRNFQICKNYFYNNVLKILDNNFCQIEYIKKSMGKKWADWRLQTLGLESGEIKKNQLLIQEEIIFNFIFNNENKNIFYNIKNKNNGVVFEKNINNFHMINFNPNQIYQIFSNITYFRNIIKKYLEIEPTIEKPDAIDKIKKIIFEKKHLLS
jgi:hypothetical protein